MIVLTAAWVFPAAWRSGLIATVVLILYHSLSTENLSLVYLAIGQMHWTCPHTFDPENQDFSILKTENPSHCFESCSWSWIGSVFTVVAESRYMMYSCFPYVSMNPGLALCWAKAHNEFLMYPRTYYMLAVIPVTDDLVKNKKKSLSQVLFQQSYFTHCLFEKQSQISASFLFVGRLSSKSDVGLKNLISSPTSSPH